MYIPIKYITGATQKCSQTKNCVGNQVIRCNTVSIYTCWGWGIGEQVGVKGCINKTNITKYSRRHLSCFFYVCPTALPCPPPGWGLCSLFLQAVHLIHVSHCDESFCSKKKKRRKKKIIHQMGTCSFLHGNVSVRLSVFLCLHVCMKCIWTSIRPW